ncbi:MAG: FdhF/YdeP family oxidoreductase [Methanobacteriota archaeon]
MILSSRPVDPVREPRRRWDPGLWASRIPLRKMGNFWEVFRALWENRDRLGYTRRILSDGVCDGCALGTRGLRDWTIDGVHLCNVRLRLLRLNTMGPLDAAALADADAVCAKPSADLRAMGRLPHPLLRRAGEAGFRRISWDEALALVADRVRATSPDRTYWYFTSRGTVNETYYVAQKAVRALGTNNVDNAARICHSPSTFALKKALGVAATTCSYRDLIGTDLVAFIGANVANNQPVMMKYLYHARKAGTKVAVVNPYREPAMEKYWVPSDLESALFGTKMADRFFLVRPGGDIAFANGTLKAMIHRNFVDVAFLRDHTDGWDGLKGHIEGLPWETLERESGLGRREMQDFAQMVGEAEKAVFVWGMGITQHESGEENVAAIVNLALTKGFVGRDGCGVMPIRGHSGVQGGAEMGCYATALPGGGAVTRESADALSRVWGFPVPSEPGITTPEMIDAALRHEVDVLFASGGNFHEVLPGPARVEEALAKIPLRVHMDIVLSSQMLVPPGEAVLLLPATTRYEMPGGGTETSTERRVILSPEIPGPRIDEARPEWRVLADLLRLVRPDRASAFGWPGTAEIRDEIARVVPFYDGIQRLSEKGESFQYGGPHLCAGWRFPTPSGRARFTVPTARPRDVPLATFRVVTRRGKQFNSMVQEEKDPINAMPRDAILTSRADLARLGLASGDAAVLENEWGALSGRVFEAEVAPGSLQVHWPEGNVLVDPHTRSPLAHIPVYKDVRARIRAVERR